MSTVRILAVELVQEAQGTLDAVARAPWPKVSPTAYDLGRARTAEAMFDGNAQAVAGMVSTAERALAVVAELARRAPDLFPGGLAAALATHGREISHA